MEKEPTFVLGEKLPNPYTVANMKQAWENLKNDPTKRIKGDELDITTTHHYVQFLPRTEEDLDLLKSDTTLILYDFPLEYEYPEGEFVYHDPSVPLGSPTYRYSSLPVLEKPYLIESIILQPDRLIDELYIPEEDPRLHQNRTSAEMSYIIESLLEEAYKIKGLNYEANGYNNENNRMAFFPSGRITVADDRLGTVGVVGAKVRARRYFTTKEAITNLNGNYTINHNFNGPVNYSIKWERSDFDIRSKTFGQAYHNGPKRGYEWDLNIVNGAPRMYAMVNIAADEYYYKSRFSLKSPPKNSFWRARVKIGVYDQEGSGPGSHCKECRVLGAIPRIYIYNRNSSAIYTTTIHELAHASHWELRRGNWNNNNTEQRLKESWADGIEWLFAIRRYGSYDNNYQLRTIENEPIYTSLFVDLNDNLNQGTLTNGRPIDRVSGYTFKQMEDVLKDSNGFNTFKLKLRDTYANSTEGNLDELFNNWN